MIINHTELLNALIQKYGLKSYLEIGVQNPANNFDKIKCENKVGTDPCLTTDLFNPKRELWSYTSDDFFKRHTGLKFDLIFIDGLHHADQIKRDFENSLRCLSDNGFIVIHDVLPENEAGTKVPRETKQWWGDVYKWAMNIGQYPEINFKTFDIDNGCMLVWKDKNNTYQHPLYLTEYNNYLNVGHIAMNVTSTVEI